MKKEELNKIAAEIANNVLINLRSQNLDCVSGLYYDCSQKIHTTVLHTVKNVLTATDHIKP